MVAMQKLCSFLAHGRKPSNYRRLLADGYVCEVWPAVTVTGAHSTLLQQTMQNLDLEPDFDLQTLRSQVRQPRRARSDDS